MASERHIKLELPNNSLVNYIKYLGCEVGFPIQVRQGVYSSDSTPFADNGIPSVSFARIA